MQTGFYEFSFRFQNQSLSEPHLYVMKDIPGVPNKTTWRARCGGRIHAEAKASWFGDLVPKKRDCRGMAGKIIELTASHVEVSESMRPCLIRGFLLDLSKDLGVEMGLNLALSMDHMVDAFFLGKPNFRQILLRVELQQLRFPNSSAHLQLVLLLKSKNCSSSHLGLKDSPKVGTWPKA